MDGDFTEQTDSESSPKDVDRLKLRDDASITEGEAEGRSLGKKLSVDFDNILDVLTVNESEFDNLPNVAGEVSESLLPKDSFASSFAPEDMSFKGSVGSFALEEEITSDVIDNIPSLTKSESHDVAPSGDPSEEGIKRDGLRKVTLEEMMIEAGQPIFQPISIEEPKLKKEPKVSKKKFRPAEIAEPELSLPSIVGTKPGKKSSLDTGASGIRMRREDKVDLKLPAQGIHLSNKSRIARNSTKLNSQEAEDVPVKKRNDPFLPDLPHTSPAETKREKKRKQKPLYMRMADKVRQLVAEEERQKHEEYLRQKNQRAKGHYNKDEIKEHIKQHDELMKMKQTEAKHNHVSQVRALRSKSRDVPESLISGSIEEQTSLGSLDSHKPTKSKHRKQLEDYDAVSYRVDDNAKERKRKHKKLMEIISPRQHHGSCNTGTADDIEMNSNSHPTNVSLSTPQVKERNEGELGTDSAEKLQQQLFSPFSDDLEAFNDIPAESLEPRPPQHDKLQDVDVRHNNASVTKAEKVFVDPFVHVDSSIKMSIDNSVIPTYIDKDWVTMLHSDGDDDPEDILLAL